MKSSKKLKNQLPLISMLSQEQFDNLFSKKMIKLIISFQKNEKFENRLKIDQVREAKKLEAALIRSLECTYAQKTNIRRFLCQAGSSLTKFSQEK